MSSSTSDMRRAVTYHASSITILWVVVLLMSIGIWLVLLVDMLRIDALERNNIILQIQVADLRLRLEPSQQAAPPVVAPAPAPTTTLPTAPPSASMSPSGALSRGSLSPDGTKYAGYNDTVKGKLGIAVEVLETKRVRYIEIFNAITESTGKGTEFESAMSVRWKDAQTIEYDVLVKKGDSWVKETRTTKIFF